MGACKSKVKGGGASMAVNEASINHLEAKIKKRLQKQSNISSKNSLSVQDVTIREKKTFSEPYYNKTMTIKKGPFGIGGTYENCPVFGCAYDVSQTSSVDIISYSSNVVNEAEDIFKDISTELKQKAKTKKTGMNAGALNAANRAINSSRDLAIENIRSKLVNLSETNSASLQKVTIEYETPPRCKDPCGITESGTSGPKVDQSAMVHIQSADILSSTLKIVEKKLADHGVDVKQSIKSSSDECVIQLLISGVSCFVCLLIIWKVFKMFEGGAKGLAKGASGAAQQLANPENLKKMTEMVNPENLKKMTDMLGKVKSVTGKGKR